VFVCGGIVATCMLLYVCCGVVVTQIILSGDSLPKDIKFFDLTLFKPTPSYVEIFGNVNAVSAGSSAATAREPSAVTFTQSGAFIRLSLWQAHSSRSVEFHFKTLEPRGLLVCTQHTVTLTLT